MWTQVELLTPSCLAYAVLSFGGFFGKLGSAASGSRRYKRQALLGECRIYDRWPAYPKIVRRDGVSGIFKR